MSWFSADSQWRVPVTVDNNGGTTPIDVSIAIPGDFGAFWGNVDASGHSIKVCDSDGYTELTWQRQTWNHTARQAVIEVDGWVPDSTDGTCVLYLYWGEDSPTDSSGSFTASTPKTGTVQPGRPAPGQVIVDAQPLPVGQDVPRTSYSLSPNEDGYLAFDITRFLMRQSAPFNGRLDYEEVAVVEVETRTVGGAYAGGNVKANTRVTQWDGRTLVYMWVTGSADNTDYVDEVEVITSTGRELIFAAVRTANTAEES